MNEPNNGELSKEVCIKKVDRVEITSEVDNSVDQSSIKDKKR
ncbi:MAG: hypothetical protein QG670_2571 [Thermoproteota archaeon]|nr:hypothetical protein [Thermoproteota archaeon]